MPVTVPICAQDHLRGPGKANNLKQSPTIYPKRYWLYFLFWFGFLGPQVIYCQKKKKKK